MDDLFENIREQCSKEIWSRGVELARQDAVSGERSSEDEVVLRVLERSRGFSAVIRLFPRDNDWAKDCSCKIDPCHHVAAAIIGLKRAQEQNRELPQAKSAGGKVQYSFTRKEGFLLFERIIVNGEQRTPLQVPLSAALSGRTDLAVSPTKEDMAIESALGGDKRGKIAFATMQRILPYLANCEIFLDGEPIALQKEAMGLSVIIRDEGLGIHVQGRRDPRILESFHNGLVRCEDGLHPQVDMSLETEDRQALVHGRIIPLKDIERFASEVLPRWEKRFPIENKARNLPQFVEAEAELELTLERHGDQLLVLPGIVYGQPAIARISEGVFRPIGQQVPIRDHDAERKLKDELWRQRGLELYHAKLLSPLEAINFVQGMSSWAGRVRGEGRADFQMRGPIAAQVSYTGGQLQVHFEGEASDQASASAVLKAWQDRSPLVPLLGGGFAALPEDWLKRYGAKIHDILNAQKEADGGLPKATLVQVADLMDDLGQELPSELSLFRRLYESEWPAATLPGDMQVELRPYQLQGVAWLQEMRRMGLGALLADDMGLGKTLQSLCCIDKGSLIIAPTSVLPNWKKEIAKFRPGLKVCVYHGSNRSWDPDADVYLSTYGLLRHDFESLDQKQWQAIILDEAQTIKNPESKVAQAALRLRGAFRLALSGTPVENRLDDLWTQFAFLNPGLLGNLKDFRQRFAKAIEEGDSEAAVRLRRILKPFMLRRLKSEVASDLPARIEKTLYTEMWPEERLLYEAIHAATKKEVLQKLEAGGSVFEALEALLRMRQACCHPSLIPSQSAAHSSKLSLLIETLEVILAEDHKALVFSQWTGLLDLLEPVLEAANIAYLRLDGSTSNRQDIVDRFQDDKGPPVLIMSIKAGGVGLNLTRADHVFILDPWWNPAVADQAADRAHRIGQERTVMIHPLVALDSVEEKIMELQNRKRALAAAALSEAGAPVLSREDLMDLLR